LLENNSSFKVDLSNESEFGKFAVQYIYPTIAKYQDFQFLSRNEDKNNQMSGADVSALENGVNVTIDEKAAMDYMNANLKTFNLELCYFKRNDFKVGWYLDTSKKSDVYLIITNIETNTLVSANSLKFEDIKACEVLYVRKSAVKEYMNSMGYTDDFLHQWNSYYYNTPEFTYKQFDDGSKILSSKKKAERPLLFLLPITVWKKLASSIYYVHRNPSRTHKWK